MQLVLFHGIHSSISSRSVPVHQEPVLPQQLDPRRSSGCRTLSPPAQNTGRAILTLRGGKLHADLILLVKQLLLSSSSHNFRI
jgi:hypothetical protein